MSGWFERAMIVGQVNSKLEAVIPVTVHGPRGVALVLEVLLDTGYSGFLTLPAAKIATLDLEPVAANRLILADGTAVISTIYQAVVAWDDQERIIEVDRLEATALTGMALMQSYELNAQIMVGGRVTLTAYTPSSP